MKRIKIGNKTIGEDEPCFIIAEAGVNHNGKIQLAKKLIDVAVEAGCDAIKFQTFNTEEVVTLESPKAEYQQKKTGNGRQYEMIKKLELSEKDFRELAEYIDQKGIIFLSTPFDKKSADLLEQLEVPAFKIGSGDLTNLPLLKYISKKGRPMVISTGMATLAEVKEAVNTVINAGNEQFILLHCTSNYPVRVVDCNLRAMNTLKKEFDVPVGYSDHTLGVVIPVVAVAMGASVIEKHFTMNKKLPGPDHSSSLEPDELKEMIKQIRTVEIAFGSEEKKPVESELELQKVVRRSIVARMDISQGTLITTEMLNIKRPGTGLAPKRISEIAGKRAKKDIIKDELITFDKVL